MATLSHLFSFSPRSSPTIIYISFIFFSLPYLCSSGQIFSELIRPNFTATYLSFIDSSGTFLASKNGTFHLSISAKPKPNYCLSILHVSSNTIVWCANRDSPISDSGQVILTTDGISVFYSNGTLAWSTFKTTRPVSSMQLHENGNLAILDASNRTMWQSFDHPTDTLLMGQPLPAGKFLVSSISEDNFSSGDFKLLVTNQDVLLIWQGQTYWSLAMDPRAFKDNNAPISFMEVNASGLYLFNASTPTPIVVWMISLSPDDFRLINLDSTGRLNVLSFSGMAPIRDLVEPEDDCILPLSCGRLGVCTDSVGSNSSYCSCPTGFQAMNAKDFLNGCSFSGGNFDSSHCSSSDTVSYLSLGVGTKYFANSFSEASSSKHENLSSCQALCSKNCYCLGLFYSNDSGSCFLVREPLGSIKSSKDASITGYMKIPRTALGDTNNNDSGEGSSNFPILGLILLPSVGAFSIFVVSAVAYILWKKRKLTIRKSKKNQQGDGGGSYSHSDTELDLTSFPGLPKRFSYEEIEAATDNFKTQIGSGGFGAVYKGFLVEDKTHVAVKKINSIGIQGKREFCTEIATIGSIHHVNLVRLRGFCAQGLKRLLVYEYMNRSSLDRSLFGHGPVLEWSERAGIAVGTARGLAYLHGGCENKIIHCDVKPENILLHDHSQVKISDFGLSKLLSPEQSVSFTTMRGTRGYLAPEWLTNSTISDKTDVYSYGMVLLEIIRGRKNCVIRSGGSSESQGSEMMSSEMIYFPMLALEMHEQGRYLELADPRLEGRVTSEEVEKMVRVALCCVHEEPGLRPSMVSVASMLEGGMVGVWAPRLESLNYLRFYGRRFNEPATMLHVFSPRQTSVSNTTSPETLPHSYLSSQDVSGPR